MQSEPLFCPHTPIAEAGRAVLAAELSLIRQHEAALEMDADETAVHETRKAIRRSYTAVRVFDAYFEPGLLESYRRLLRKLMRRLAPCRDQGVFLQKLMVNEETAGSLPALAAYWRAQKAGSDEKLRRFLGKMRRRALLESYEEFTHSPGQGVLPPAAVVKAGNVRHLGPVLIYQRLADVRAFEDHLEDAPLERMHRLRIQFKELRYALGFFEPLLGTEIELVEPTLSGLQTLLGDLNDATVALRMLDQTPELEQETGLYRTVQKAEVTRLTGEFPALWSEFASLAWRKSLAAAVAVL